MFERIRYKASIWFAQKAKENIDKGDFKSIMKGLEYTKMSVLIVPPDEELNKFGKRLYSVAEELKTTLKEN